MQRIGCGEGDRSFCDEGKAHDKVHGTGFPFFFRKFILEEQCGKRDGTGRNHAADHDCCHDMIVARSDGGCTEDISCLVEGAAHINGHHDCHDDSQEDSTGSAHVGQCGVQSCVQSTNGRLYQELHDQTYKKDAAQGI